MGKKGNFEYAYNAQISVDADLQIIVAMTRIEKLKFIFECLKGGGFVGRLSINLLSINDRF